MKTMLQRYIDEWLRHVGVDRLGCLALRKNGRVETEYQ